MDLKFYGWVIVYAGCVAYLVYRFVWRQSLPSTAHQPTQGDKQLADDAFEASERRVRCSRSNHVGYRRDIHRGYCPSCGAAVPPDAK